jgi:hypothetical protein
VTETTLDIETRIEALERRVVRLRIVCTALVALVIAAVVAAFVPRETDTSQASPDVLEARQILLRDSGGTVRVAMDADESAIEIQGPDAAVRFCGRDATNLLEMNGRGAGLEFGFVGPREVSAPHFYLYDAGGAGSLDLEPTFANFHGDGGHLSLNANEAGDTGFTFRNVEGGEILFRAP